MSVKRLTPDQSKALVYIIGGIVAVILIVIVASKLFGGFDTILQFLGLQKSKDEKEDENVIDEGYNDANDPSSGWNPHLWETAPAGSSLLTDDKAESLAYKILASVGLVWDEPTEGVAAIKQCHTKAQVSQVVNKFYTEYNRDLISWLENKYDTTDQKEKLAIMIEYVKSLPKY